MPRSQQQSVLTSDRLQAHNVAADIDSNSIKAKVLRETVVSSTSSVVDTGDSDVEWALDPFLVLCTISLCTLGAFNLVALQVIIYGWESWLLWCPPAVYLVICFLGFVYDVISFYGSKTKLLSCRTFTLPEYLRRSASYEDERVDTSLEVTECRITEFLEALRQASNQEPEFFEHFGATHRATGNKEVSWKHHSSYSNLTDTSDIAAVSSKPALVGTASAHVVGVLLLPALFTILYGGFAASGGCVLWSFLSPVSALLFTEPGSPRALQSFLAFVLVVASTVICEVFLDFSGLPQAYSGHLYETKKDPTLNLQCESGEGVRALEATLRFNIHVTLCAVIIFWMLWNSRKEANLNTHINRDLLYSMLPKPVVKEILANKKRGDKMTLTRMVKMASNFINRHKEKNERPGLVRSHVGVTARSHHHATIIFINIFGLDDLSSITNPAQLMEFIDSIFMMYDRLAEYHGIIKMRTLCDGYMAATGLLLEFGNPFDHKFHATRAVLFSLAVLEEVREGNFIIPTSGKAMTIQIGLHSGSMHTGVVGAIQPQYDAFGDMPNIAARMKSKALANTVNMSQVTKELIEKDVPGFFPFKARLNQDVKGKGKMNMYHLSAGDVGVTKQAWAHATVRKLMESMRRRHLKLKAAESGDLRESDAQEVSTGDVMKIFDQQSPSRDMAEPDLAMPSDIQPSTDNNPQRQTQSDRVADLQTHALTSHAMIAT